MARERLLIVEDERIVAADLHDMLKRLDYEVVGIVSSGEEAIQKTEETRPDLVLMDIQLKGELDGVQAAETIWSHFGIPITYLTAYADEKTLERAKATLPFGYILKPFEERDLRTTIEIALYKHRMEATLTRMDTFYSSTLGSLAEAVIATNLQGGISFMNPAAEALTGWLLREVYGKKFNDIVHVSSRVKPDMPVPSSPRSAGILKARNGQDIPIEYTLAPLKDPQGDVTGNVVLLHPVASPTKIPSSV